MVEFSGNYAMTMRQLFQNKKFHTDFKYKFSWPNTLSYIVKCMNNKYVSTKRG